MNNIFPTRPTVGSSPLPLRPPCMNRFRHSPARSREYRRGLSISVRCLQRGWRRKNKLITINPCVDGSARHKSQPGQPADPVEVEEVLLLHQLWATIAASVVLGRTGSIDIASETFSLCLLSHDSSHRISHKKIAAIIDYLLCRRCRKITNCTIGSLDV